MTKTLAMLAPVSPYRGGVSQHSTMLANALARHCDLKLFSYKRLYPKILYPGQFQKDSQTSLTSKVTPRCVLDTINPSSWYRTAREIIECGVDTVILPWWTFFLSPCYLLITWIVRRKGIKILFVCHNFVDHETTWWKKAVSRVVLRNGGCFLVHANSIRDDLNKLLPSIPALMRPMPIYEDYPNPKERLPRRASLELLFFGFVRKYKGLDILLQAAATMERADWHISVVGECWEDSGTYIRLARELGIEDKVEFVFQYVRDEMAASFIDRADYVVLPYRAATGSAVIPLAYHYEKPVIVTPVGGLREVVDHGSTGLVLSDLSIRTLTDVLDCLPGDNQLEFSKGIRRWKAENSWDALAGALVMYLFEERVEPSQS